MSTLKNVVIDALTGTEYPFKDGTTIGSSIWSDIQIEDESVLKSHAVVKRLGNNAFTVYPAKSDATLKSQDGCNLPEVPILDDTHLYLGNRLLIFKLPQYEDMKASSNDRTTKNEPKHPKKPDKPENLGSWFHKRYFRYFGYIAFLAYKKSDLPLGRMLAWLIFIAGIELIVKLVKDSKERNNSEDET